MASTLQQKRRIGGTQGDPGGSGNEGELAIYFPGAAGGTAKPTLYASDGGGWRKIVDGNDVGGVPNFSATRAYKVGDVVIQNGNIYQATGASAAGAFSPGNWAQLSGNGVPNWQANQAYTAGQMVVSGGEIYQAPGPVAGAAVFAAGSWTKITNTAGVSVTGHNAVSTATTVEAAFNADKITVANGEIAVYTYGGTAYIYTGSPGAPVTGAVAGNFTQLGAATAFASAAEVTAGTATDKALNAKLLRDELVRALGPVTAAELLAGTAATNTPDGTPANDANRLVALNGAGKIDPGFIALTGLNLVPGKDVLAGKPPTYTPAKGDIFFHSGIAGPVHADWQGAAIAAGATIKPNDMMLFDGTNWELIASEVDLANYLPLAGGAMTPADTTKVTFAPTTTDGSVVIIDGGQGKLKDVVIDCGTYP